MVTPQDNTLSPAATAAATAPDPCSTVTIGLTARLESVGPSRFSTNGWDVTLEVTATNPSSYDVSGVAGAAALNGQREPVTFGSIPAGLTEPTTVDFPDVNGDPGSPNGLKFSGFIQWFYVGQRWCTAPTLEGLSAGQQAF